jgi:O-antigen/teichoic acid export membrane protein
MPDDVGQTAPPLEDGTGGGLRRHGSFAFGASAVSLGVAIVSGIVIARTLGTVGRGQIAAITAAPQLVGWMAALGCSQAVGYHQARHRTDGARLIGTWLVILAALAVVGLVAGELLLHLVLSAQTHRTFELAQVFMPTLVFLLLSELAYGVLLGDQDFGFYNLMRAATPAATALGYVGAWAAGDLSVSTALIVLAAVGITGAAVAGTRAVRRHGIGRPSAKLARTTLWYGIRAHGTNVGGILNGRLDSLLIPAFLSASTVGLYSVATNVSWIVISISGSLATLAGPAATRQGGAKGTATVIGAFHVTLGVALVLATGAALSCGVAVKLVYGSAFAGSVTPLRLLLPGCVLWAAAGVLISGLYSRNRPFTAALTQAAGIVVTAVGLPLFLRSGGIVAAAVVSTVAYAVIFLAAVTLYRREVQVPWSAFLPSSRDLRGWRHGLSKAQPEGSS